MCYSRGYKDGITQAHNTNHSPYSPHTHQSTFQPIILSNLRTCKHDGANLVYRDNRLLIGWRTSRILQTETTPETLRTEAWLGEVSPGEAAGDYLSPHRTTTDFLRFYTSSDGSHQLYRGVMGIDEAHPAILHRHVDETAVASFLERGETERLEWAERRLCWVRNGHWQYREREGGELKAFEKSWDDIVEQVVEMPQREK